MVLSVIIYLILLGGALAIVKLLPIDDKIKQIIVIVVVVAIVIVLLQLLLGGGVPNFNVRLP